MRDFEIVREFSEDKKIVKDEEGTLMYLKKLSIYNVSVFAWLKQHPSTYVPEIIEYEEKDGKLLVLEKYIDGISLKDLSQHDISYEERREILLQIIDGLNYLHHASPPIIHRDLKEENIMIDKENMVKIIDYDAAKRYQKNEPRDTVLIGTEGSAAPEQYGFGASDMRTDIYGLGVLIRKIFPDDLDMLEIADKCTQINPNDRYQSIDEIKQTLINQTQQSSKLFSINIPGFRSGNILHVLIACFGYFMIVYITLTVDVENNGKIITDPFLVFINRVFVGMWLLLTVDIFTSYTHFFDHFPLVNSEDKIKRIIGKFLASFFVVCALAFIVVIIEGIVGVS